MVPDGFQSEPVVLPYGGRLDAVEALHSLYMKAAGNAGRRGQVGKGKGSTEQVILGTDVRKLATDYTWDDLVLPSDVLASLKEMCNRIQEPGNKHEKRNWKVLFTGPEGTGKTLAAQIIANALNVDLYEVDLPKVMAGSPRETKGRLDQIFDFAGRSNAILLFSEKHGPQQRWPEDIAASIASFNGVAVLESRGDGSSTGGQEEWADYAVRFPFPDESARLQIWMRVRPGGTPLDSGVNLAFLARLFELSGGEITDVARHAALLAEADESNITLSHLLHAMRREYQKMGRSLAEPGYVRYAV